MTTCFYYLRISYPNSVSVKVTTCPDGWVVDKTKIMHCHLQTEVVVEVKDELGKDHQNEISSLWVIKDVPDGLVWRAVKVKPQI